MRSVTLRRWPVLDLDHPALAWCRINDQLIFLDVEHDRYFRLPDARNRQLLEQLAKAADGSWHQPSAFPLPESWQSPEQSSSAIHDGSFRLGDIARSLWMQRRVEAKLASGGFANVLADLYTLLDRRTVAAHDLSDGGRATVRAFEHARLLRTAAERCLSRSIALAVCLASRGDRSHVVLGVRLSPFGAHSWAQQGDTVLNDSLEEVQRYQPILVV